MKRKLISLFLCIAMCMSLVTGCGSSAKNTTDGNSDKAQSADSQGTGKATTSSDSSLPKVDFTQAVNAGGKDVANGTFKATDAEMKSKATQMIGAQDQFKGMKIAFSQRNIAGSEWWEQLVDFAKLEADYLGIKLTVYDAGNDLNKQITDIETLLSLKPDAMIINPYHSTGVLPAVAEVHNANIPLTVVNCALDASGGPFTFVSCDVENSGYQGGYALAKAYDKEHGWKAHVKALVLSSSAQEKESDLRRWGQIMGWTDYYLDKYGKNNLDIVSYQYYNWQPEPAMKVTLDTLQAHPDLDVIFSACDGGCQGVEAALKQLNLLGKIPMCSIDGRKSVLKWIKDGDKGVVCTVANDPRQMGKWAVYLAAQQAKGVTTPATFYCANTLFDKSNVNEYYDPNSTY